ncbi:MAG TPA: EAL domain-containing protein [Gemmatimonadaceae bacterium]|nr:EAL domain-containing protein [Gemmatimonadaceae bacterium]
METSAGEGQTLQHRAHDTLRKQIGSVTASLFAVAAIALVAIAATIGGTYYAHERTVTLVENSREISRLARSAYVLTVERELAILSDAPPQAAEKAATAAATRFSATLDSLFKAASNSAERRNHVNVIKEAQTHWNASIAVAGSKSTGRASQKKRFDILRTRLAVLTLAEDVRYAESQGDERRVTFLATAAVLAELLILLLVFNRLSLRLMYQANEAIQQSSRLQTQSDRLQIQTEELERSNIELAIAIEAAERARIIAEEAAAEQAALFNAIPEVFFILDRDGRYHKVSPTNDALLAGPRDKLLGQRVHEVLPAPVAGLALQAISKALDTNQRVPVEYPLDLDGKTTWFAGTVTPLAEDRVLWMVRDISDTRMAAEALKESEARFRNLVEHSPQAVALHSEGRLLYANPACATLLGFTDPEKLLGAPLLRFITRDTAPRLLESLAALGRTPMRALTAECQFHRTNDARLLAVEVTSVPVSYDGRAGVLSILHDVTERKQLEEQLAHQAFHDPLTNLANRVLFKDRVEHALQRAAGGNVSPAVLFIDLDNFKAVNDGLGHSAGDWLLIEVAARLTACLRPADTVARLGGDEFAVLLDDEVAKPMQVADVILEAFMQPFTVQGTDILVTMSIGIATMLPHQGADDVLRNADLALYRAKGEGKACAASFEPEMHVAARRRLELETELRRAINGEGETGNLVLFYQPISRLSTGRMFGFEALVRWQHPERGLLEPLDFISLAEETGLIVPLGRWVVQEACRQTREWQDRYQQMLRGTGMSLMVGVNLSGRHLSHPGVVHDVAESLRRTGLTPSHLILEMTESMLVHDNRATLERLHALKGLGVRLSIDDFGTGYSSLAYLERFPVDSLKMDRSFITGLGSENSKSPLAEAVIGLGRILGLRVVAEGIETREQWERLRSLGCGLGQGYHISYPLPAFEFEHLLETSARTAKGLPGARFPVSSNGARRTPLSPILAIG